MHCSHGQKNYGNMSIEKLSPLSGNKELWKWSYAKKHPHMEKKIWKFNCGTSRPFQKGSDYQILRNLDLCIFISKKELWKNRAPARRSCLLAHAEPFFHFHNSVDDHIHAPKKMHMWIYLEHGSPRFKKKNMFG